MDYINKSKSFRGFYLAITWKWGVFRIIISICILSTVCGFYCAPVATTGTPGNTYIIGGTLSGLVSGESITLMNNNSESLALVTNGSFTFMTKVTTYDVTIQTQPSTLRCIVQNGGGTASANITDVVVTCPMAYVNSQTWMRCSSGQMWNASTGDCSGSGVAPGYGASLVEFCLTSDNSCNSGTNNGTLVSGPAFDACNSLNSAAGTYQRTSWRLPTKTELSGLVVCSDGTLTPLNDYGTDPYRCGWNGTSYVNGSYTAPTIDNALFPNTASLEYWTQSADINQTSSAWYTGFQDGWTYTASKSSASFVRCLSDI